MIPFPFQVAGAGIAQQPSSGGGGGGSFPTWISITPDQESDSADDPKTVSYPATVASGDLLILLVSWGSNVVTINTPSGWTQKHLYTGANANMAVYTKTAAGSEGGTTFSVDFSSAARAQFQIIRIGAGTFAGVEVTANNSGATSSTTAACASNTPSWGTKKTLWIAAASTQNTRSATSWPLTDHQTTTASASTGSTMRTLLSCSLEDEVSSKSPGNFTLNTAAVWATATIAVEPA